MDENDKTLLYAGLFVGLTFFFTRDSAPVSVKLGLYICVWAAAIYFSGEYFVWSSRYRDLPKVLSNNFFGSILDRPVIVGDYAIFNAGASLYPVPMRGKLATFVCHTDSLTRLGANYVTCAFAKRIPAIKLPPDVRSYIFNRKGLYNVEKVFFALFSESLYKTDVKYGKIENELQNSNLLLNHLTDLLEGKNDVVVEENQKAKDLVGNESLIAKFKDMMKPKPGAGNE